MDERQEEARDRAAEAAQEALLRIIAETCSTPPPLALPTAYCAPGRKVISAIALALKGEQVADIVESPYLEGQTDVLIVAPAVFDLPDFNPGDYR